MRMKHLVASLLVGSFPLAAMAVPIAGEFTGTVWGTSESGAIVPDGIGAGAIVTGAFQFENIGQAPFVTVDGVNASSYLSSSPGSLLSISIGSSLWEAQGLSVIVRNDSEVLNDDLLQLVYSGSLKFFDPAFPDATSFPGIPTITSNSSFGISLFDTAAPLDLVSSQALPDSASQINLDSVLYRNGSLFGSPDGANSYYQINFTIDSVSIHDVATPVPEPGTLPLMAAGLLTACWLLRRRVAAQVAAAKRRG